MNKLARRLRDEAGIKYRAALSIAEGRLISEPRGEGCKIAAILASCVHPLRQRPDAARGACRCIVCDESDEMRRRR